MSLQVSTLYMEGSGHKVGNKSALVLGALYKILPFVFTDNHKKYKPTKTKDLAKAMYKSSLIDKRAIMYMNQRK